MRWSVVLVLLLAGCGPGVPPLPQGLALRAQQLVGMPSPVTAALPEFSLYGDGTVIRPGPVQGALRTAEVVQVGHAQATEFYEEAHDAGLAANQDIPNPSVLDGYLQVFVLNSGGQRFVTRAANPEDSSDLVEFHGTLRAEGPVTPYRPTRIAAVGWVPDPTKSGRPWPFAPFGQRTREGSCVIMDASEFAALAGHVPEGTFWRSGDAAYVVVFRPLLPDESTCADLDV